MRRARMRYVGTIVALLGLTACTPKELQGPTFSDLTPHYSPDGEQIVFSSNRGGGGDHI